MKRLWSDMEAAGLEPEGEPRWVYLTSPEETPDPSAHLTELVWRVRPPHA